MSKIVITGGAGFIGSQLGYCLEKKGHDVILVDDMSFGYEDNLVVNNHKIGKFVKMDIRSKEIFGLFESADYVFHFAGISSLPVCQSNPSYAIDVNVAGTANVLEACRINNVKRVVFASTSAVYENNENYPSMEKDEVDPDLIYSMSKLQAEMICKSYFKNYGLDVVILRYNNVYGPHQIEKGQMATVIGIFENYYKSKKPMPVVRPGNQTRRFTHISDTVETCYIAWKKNLCRHYSISNRKSYSILNVAKMFSSKIKYLPKRPGERYVSSLINTNLSNKVHKHFGKVYLKNYIKEFIVKNS